MKNRVLEWFTKKVQDINEPSALSTPRSSSGEEPAQHIQNLPVKIEGELDSQLDIANLPHSDETFLPENHQFGKQSSPGLHQATDKGQLPAFENCSVPIETAGEADHEQNVASSLFFDIEPLSVVPPSLDRIPIWPKNITTPPAFALDFGESNDGSIVLRAGSLRGGFHESTGVVRQDAYAVLVDDTQIHIAVCDGVGSQPLSDTGAAIAATIAVEQSSAGAKAQDLINAVIGGLISAANERNVHPVQLSTTLCWLRIDIGSPSAAWTVEVGEWGDSEALRYDTKAQISGHPDWSRLTENRQDDTSVNDVQALPGTDQPIAYASKWLWEPGQVLGAFSDGIAAHLDHDTVLGHALAKVWHEIPSAWEFASHLAHRNQGSNDDRTAVVLWRRA